MYHAITRARVRALWRWIGTGEYQVAVATAAPDLEFRFAGPPPIGVHLRGRMVYDEVIEDTYALAAAREIQLRQASAAA
jgi:hypothetical protein